MGGAKRPRGASYEKKAPKAFVIFPGEGSGSVHVLLALADDALRAVHEAGAVHQEGPEAVASWRRAREELEAVSRCVRRYVEVLEAPVVVAHEPERPRKERQVDWIYETQFKSV